MPAHGPASAGLDGAGDRLEGTQIVPGDEGVDVRKRRRHAARQRFEGGVLLLRIDPHDPAAELLESCHLARNEFGVLTFPAIRKDDDRAAPRGPALRVVKACSAAPIRVPPP